MMGLRSPPAAPGGGRHLGEDAEREAEKPFPQQDSEDQHQPAEAERRGGEGETDAMPLRRRRPA